jgi:hypothetical protein
MEFHHPAGSNRDELVPMTREGHRLGTNYLLNHPWLDTKKMADTSIFASGVGRNGRLVAFLEADDDVSWFYILDQDLDPDSSQIFGAVQVFLGAPDFSENDVEVR